MMQNVRASRWPARWPLRECSAFMKNITSMQLVPIAIRYPVFRTGLLVTGAGTVAVSTDRIPVLARVIVIGVTRCAVRCIGGEAVGIRAGLWRAGVAAVTRNGSSVIGVVRAGVSVAGRDPATSGMAAIALQCSGDMGDRFAAG